MLAQLQDRRPGAQADTLTHSSHAHADALAHSSHAHANALTHSSHEVPLRQTGEGRELE